ncbi:glycosyltransferase family 4 protein [Brachybacterium alimentarium]|uniref:glycosyltransferase family 4 protein n=1 Tax=Brachybacterium alimentarium TaxID=47845 RepID=UPI003FD0CC7B
MRVTYIHQHFVLPEEPGGSRPWEFGRRLAAAGHEVTMICGGAEPLDEVREGLRIKRIEVPYSNQMSMPQRIFSFVRFMVLSTKEAMVQNSDLVFASSTPLTVAVPGLVASALRRVPFVFEVRDLWPEAPIRLGLLKNPVVIRAAQLLEKVAYRRADQVVALSPSMAEGVTRVWPRAEVHMIPNSSDTAMFRKDEHEIAAIREREGWGDDDFVLTYCGSFGQIYYLEWAVRLAAEFAGSKVRVQLLGDGATMTGLNELAKDFGLSSAELFRGAKPKVEAAELVAASDMLFSTLIDNPTLEGSSLNKAFDAMAAGRPMVFNHRGWLAESMAQAGAGWIVSKDPKEAAQEILALVRKPEDVAEAGRRSARMADHEFSRDALFETLHEVLAAAAALGRRSRRDKMGRVPKHDY